MHVLIDVWFVLLSMAWIMVIAWNVHKISNPESTFSVGLLMKQKLFLVMTSIICIGALGISIWYFQKQELDAVIRITKWLMIVWGLYCLAWIDAKKRIIPNKMIVVLLGIRVIILIAEVIVAMPFVKQALMYPLLGAIIGGGIIGVAMIVSGHGVGAGDVKMFFVIGAFAGSTEIIAVLFYTFLSSAILGLALLLTKKAKMKDTVPLAPFAFIGILAEYIMLITGGLK